MRGESMLHMCAAPCECLSLVPLPSHVPLIFTFVVTESERRWCARHVHASHLMCTAFDTLKLGGCIVETSYQCALQVLCQLLCVPPCHLVTSNETFHQHMCVSGVDCEVALTLHALCVDPPSILMHIGYLSRTTMPQQDQEGSHYMHRIFVNIRCLRIYSQSQLAQWQGILVRFFFKEAGDRLDVCRGAKVAASVLFGSLTILCWSITSKMIR